MGAWNSHISLGNALGAIVATACVDWGMDGHDWPLGFEVPGLIVALAGLMVFWFLESDPAEVAGLRLQGSPAMDLAPLLHPALQQQHQQLQQGGEEQEQMDAGFARALLIPNVAPFCVCLFFAKMCTNALLFWGPMYLSNDVGFSTEQAGYLCTFFDLGGCLGGLLAGLASDRARARHGTVALGFLLVSAPVLFSYYSVTHARGPETGINVWMMILAGLFVNGPVALITTAVSADLGSHASLKGNARLQATVAGMIDASGSLGAAVQGAVIGLLVAKFSWSVVWTMLASGSLVAAACLVGVVRGEIWGAREFDFTEGACIDASPT
jgi:OPA family glycerol-3-phosphate transporter-like MFS transporter 1/2